MRRKVSLPTAIVQAAQKRYPQILNAAVEHIGTDPPYGKQRVDARTRDKELVRMLPEQLAALAEADPKAYADAQQRLETLRQRANDLPPLPAQDAFEGSG